MPYPFWIRNVGKKGEYIARRYYHRRGYHLVAKNVRMGHGELDLIMAHHKQLLFVEVKARSDRDETLASVLKSAQERRLVHLAKGYIAQYSDLQITWEFHLVLVKLQGTMRFQLSTVRI